MQWDAVSAIGQIVGALAVIGTLLYLATQIRQTNQISRFGTSKEIMTKFDTLNAMVASDPALRSALRRAPPLTDDEEEQVYTFANMYVNTWVTCQAAHDNGLVDHGFYLMAKKDVHFEITRWPNFADSVNRVLANYPEFRDYDIFSGIKAKVAQEDNAGPRESSREPQQ